MASPQPANSTSPTPIRYGVLVLISLAASSAYLTRYCLAVANTTIGRELHLDDAQMGQVIAAWGLGYFICQVPGGWLGSWIGTRKTLAGLSLLWSALTVWTSLATSFRSLWWSRMTFGLAQAGLVPNTAAVVKSWFPASRRGIASACITAAMSLGGVVTMKLTGELLGTYHFDWRHVFQAYSMVGVLWAVAFYWYFRCDPQKHPWVNAAELELIHDTPGAVPDIVETDTGDQEAPRFSQMKLALSLLTSRSMWGICIQSYFRAAGYLLFVTWLPAFLEYAYGLSVKEAASYTTFPLIGVILGTLFGGVIVDLIFRRSGSRKLSRTGVAVVALAVCAALTFASTHAESPLLFVGLLASRAFLSGLGSPPPGLPQWMSPVGTQRVVPRSPLRRVRGIRVGSETGQNETLRRRVLRRQRRPTRTTHSIRDPSNCSKATEMPTRSLCSASKRRFAASTPTRN